MVLALVSLMYHNMVKSSSSMIPHPKPHFDRSTVDASMAGPEPNTPWPSTSSSMTRCKPIPLIKSGTSSVAQPVDLTAPDSDRDNFFFVSHARIYLPEGLDDSLESFVPETPKRRSKSIYSTPKSQLVFPTSQPRTPVKTLSKKHHHVIIPTLLKEILGPPHGCSNFGSE